jgi:DNA-binding MarR family transcriptional regulator
MLRLFEKLRALRAFEKPHVDFAGTVEDYHLIGEIGSHQAKGKPLTLKQLSLLDIGSIATVQRRLRQLKELGLVKHRRAANDRRAIELTLSPKCVRIFATYDTLMHSKSSPRDASRESGEPRHRCGLCDGDSGGRNLIVAFLAKGLKRGDKCVLVAPAEMQGEILAGLPHRRRATEQLIVSEGCRSADAQFAFFKRALQEAKQAGQAVCLAADMSWTLSKNVPLDVMLDIEKRFDVLAGKLPLTGLCVYDARRFSSGDFLQAVKCHRDHAHHPIMLG